MDNKKIGQFISERRKEQGLNQKKLAQKLNVTDKAVSKWETGRGIPDVSILQPLADTLEVTVTEILNGEKFPEQEAANNQQIKTDDKQLIKRLKTKRKIRLGIEGIITIIFLFGIYTFYDTFKLFANVLDMYLHKNEIYFLSISTIIFIIISVLWLLTVIITAIFRKKAAVLKTIVICLAVSFYIGSSVHMAVMEDNRPIQIYNEPIESVSYLNYNDFFDGEFTTQINVKETNDIITENYSAYLESPVEQEQYNYVHTECVASSKKEITKKYYNEQKEYLTENTINADMDSGLCKKINASEGFYVIGNRDISGEDIELVFIRSNQCFHITVSEGDIKDEKLLSLIAEL